LAGATGMDLHRMWDNRCLECHGHSGAFARQFLSVSSGQLQGRHHMDNLHRFLSNQHPSDSEVDAIYSMLLAQANSQEAVDTAGVTFILTAVLNTLRRSIRTG
jgi:hypothetical protein